MMDPEENRLLIFLQLKSAPIVFGTILCMYLSPYSLTCMCMCSDNGNVDLRLYNDIPHAVMQCNGRYLNHTQSCSCVVA